MRTLRRAPATALMMVAALLLTLTPSAFAQKTLPTAFDQVSADASFVLVTPNFQRTSKQIAALNDALGLGVPEMADVLGLMKRELGLSKGVRDDGAWLIVGGSADKLIASMQNNDEPPLVILVPVSDYNAFLGNFEGAKTDGDVTEVEMKPGGEGFVKKAGNFAVLGPAKQAVADYKPGNATNDFKKQIGELCSHYVGGSDIALFVNLRTLSPKLQPMLASLLAEAKAEIGQEAGQLGAMAGIAQNMVTLYGNGLQAMLRDGDAAVLSGDLDDRGLGLTLGVQFKDGSRLAKVVGDSGGSSSKLLAALPDSPYLFSFAANLEGMRFDGLMEELLGDTKGPIVDMIRRSTGLSKMMKGYATTMTISPNAQALGPNMFGGISVVQADQPKAYLDKFKTELEAMKKFKLDLAALAGANADPNAPPMEMTFQPQYTPNVLNMDGTPVHQYSIRWTLPPALVEQLGPAGPMIMMAGATGTGGYVALTDKYVVMTNTPDPAAMKTALAAAKADGGGLGTTGLIPQVRKVGLGEAPVMEGYVNIGGIMSFVNTMMAMFGAPQQIEVPKNLPPIAMGVDVHKGAVTNRLYVPRKVIVFMKDVGIAMQRMAPGAGPGQPQPF